MTACYQCGDEIVRDRFGKWAHTNGHPDNGHRAAPNRRALSGRFGFARDDEVMVEGRPARVLRVERLGILVAFHDDGAVILVDPATAVKL